MILVGYFEGPGHDISWFNTDDYHFEAFSREQSQQVDTLLFGRKTYELMKGFWPTPQAQELQPEVAQFVNEKRKAAQRRPRRRDHGFEATAWQEHRGPWQPHAS